ncbi:MAG: hypothetical protein ACPHCN_12110 [Mycobacterium sp.]
MKPSTLVVGVGMMILAGIAAGGFTSALLTSDPWTPLGDFPDQSVSGITDTHITVEGTKCYDEAVTVAGSFGWQSLDPAGVVVLVGSGTSDRDAGCLTQEFRNPIPDEVLEHPEVRLWKIQGTETPIADGDGEAREGVPKAWSTEPFTLNN